MTTTRSETDESSGLLRMMTGAFLLAALGLSATPATGAGLLGEPIPRALPRRASPSQMIPPDPVLRVLTLNVAHGRGLAFHQALESTETIHANLRDIGALIENEAPDVVALQEVDGPSAWSGSFNQVATLAAQSGFAHTLRGRHGTNIGPFHLDYGTALMARLPMWRTESRVFAESWRDNKGFVVASVQVPGFDGLEIDIASVHLDFMRASMRARQITKLIAALGPRDRPLVVVGDMNCDWHEATCLPALARGLGLRAFDPRTEAPTFPADEPSKRLDWILISDELEFAGYRTLTDPVSDHRAVVAEVRRRDNG